MPNTIKINTILTLIKELPQQNTTELLNSLILLAPTNYQVGIRNLPVLSSDEETVIELFNSTSELLVQDTNTIMLFSTKPFYLRINTDNEILENIYQFTYTATKAIDIYVANLSIEDPVDIQYVIANTNLLGSSYVYS